MKKPLTEKEKNVPQLLEKWTGGHARGRLDLPAINVTPAAPKKKTRKLKSR